MNRRKGLGLLALTATAALTLAACGSSTSSSTTTTYYGEGITSVVNPSNTAANKTLIFDTATTPDSTDYANTYYAFNWDFVRLYSMSLLTYKSCPGACGLQLAPDLATGLGTVSDNGLIWTYHIQPDVKFQNGVTVTAQDVKYGIERTFAKNLLPDGPVYYQTLLNDPSYPGPYVDPSKNLWGLTSVTTPNSTTIQFHLLHPFADFNYVVAIPQSTPVLPSWDTGAHGGANFQLDPISTGPYEFQSYTLNKELVLVKNPYWKPATDPQAKQLVSKIIVYFNLNQATVDQNQIANYADIDQQGLGVQTAARARVLSTPSLKADADDALNNFLRFAYINSVVIPNVHCREAIEYAADKTTLQDAYGGPIVGGQIASTVIPPIIPGYQKFDLYNALSMPGGDDAAAKAQLTLCGKPSGFTTGLAYRSDRPTDVAAASALQAALGAVGIKLVLHGYPTAEYYSNYAGVPAYVHRNDLGIDLGGWAADWPDGFGFLYDLTDGAGIAPAGNANISEINVPAINSLFNTAANDTNTTSANAIYAEIDKDVMADAYILPIVYQKVLLYRNPNMTNVYMDQYYGMYNYAVLGLK
ncbi:MAG TPA: ABC transporter substrate-binding protein [Streptosporangiaceae bacterium]|nr:ABC transporter substrate-binding protein [Streptosporangiaceae bacterium]